MLYTYILNYTYIHTYVRQNIKHQVVLLSMPQFFFGEHALEDALTTHGNLFVLLCIYHAPPFLFVSWHA